MRNEECGISALENAEYLCGIIPNFTHRLYFTLRFPQFTQS